MSGPKMTDAQRQEVLDAVTAGLHPQIACTAAGLGRTYFYDLRYRARNGNAPAQEFLAAIDSAAARGELADVQAVRRATAPVENKPLQCPHCDGEYEVEPETLALWVAKLTDVAKAKGVAADVAIKKLERRHPERWSQKVVHTVQEEHQRLLNVLQRELVPSEFERILECYLSEVEAGEQPEAAEQKPVH